MKTYILLISWAAVVFGALSAGLWFYSTVAKVVDKSTGNWDNPPLVRKERGQTIDILATAEKQTQINRWAAAATALASLCAATSLLLTQISD